MHAVRPATPVSVDRNSVPACSTPQADLRACSDKDIHSRAACVGMHPGTSTTTCVEYRAVDLHAYKSHAESYAWLNLARSNLMAIDQSMDGAHVCITVARAAQGMPQHNHGDGVMAQQAAGSTACIVLHSVASFPATSFFLGTCCLHAILLRTSWPCHKTGD